MLTLPEEKVDWKEERRLWKEEELIAQVRLQRVCVGVSMSCEYLNRHPSNGFSLSIRPNLSRSLCRPTPI